MDFVTPMTSKLINENTSMQLRCSPAVYCHAMISMSCSEASLLARAPKQSHNAPEVYVVLY